MNAVFQIQCHCTSSGTSCLTSSRETEKQLHVPPKRKSTRLGYGTYSRSEFVFATGTCANLYRKISVVGGNPRTSFKRVSRLSSGVILDSARMRFRYNCESVTGSGLALAKSRRQATWETWVLCHRAAIAQLREGKPDLSRNL
jgi:hypothetical protein